MVVREPNFKRADYCHPGPSFPPANMEVLVPRSGRAVRA